MSQLTEPGVGQGKVWSAVILPDTASSARYVSFDAPYLTEAFQKAGLTSSQYKIDNAQGVDATQLTDAQAAITARGHGAGLRSAGQHRGRPDRAAYAKSHGVKVISYDRATFTGTNTYYVSFDNVKVGTAASARASQQCVSAWGVSRAQGLRARRRGGHRQQRHPLRPGLQLGDLEQAVDPAHAG